MPNVLRKILIYAGNDGIVLQSHGPNQHQSLRVDYRSRRVSVQTKDDPPSKHDVHLESYGIIGLINVASLYFLVAITKREQVAQIFDKPIYRIIDIAILPLSSQSDAREAIVAASGALQQGSDVSESDYSDSEDEGPSTVTNDIPGSPPEDEGPYTHMNRSSTSIAEDVAKRKASYGRFASQWLSRQVWGPARILNQRAKAVSGAELKSSIELHDYSGSEAAEANDESLAEIANQQNMTDMSTSVTHASAVSLLPKILRSIKMIFCSRSFYFAYEFDLTRRFGRQDGRSQFVSRDKLDSQYFWNRRIGSAFIEAGQDVFLMPIIQGFVGQKTFSVSPKQTTNEDTTNDDETTTSSLLTSNSSNPLSSRSYLLTLISRRSVKRSGLRYLRRGIDDEGNCANTVETEQILSTPGWDTDSALRSFIQVRGSIPLYFSQSPYSLKPIPILHNSASANEAAFKRHFQALKAHYGSVQIAMLVDKHGTEVAIGEAYQNMYQQLHKSDQLSDVKFTWFDFHSECRGMRFENVQRLVNNLMMDISAWGETIVINNRVSVEQGGVIRTNCMDCLDRTNVAQSAFGQHMLQRNLAEDGFTIDLLHDESTNWFNILWADNGDAISRQYASTAALKGDFTRTRKRNWRGQMNDLGLTLSRYYSNMVNDYFSQAVIDFLLSNVSWKIFEDFESTMMSVDPGISVESAREAAIENCAKIVIQGSEEDLLHGWTMLVPAQENTLRTLPFEETVVLLTDAAIYCCKFDWNTEKVASFEKVDLRSISKVRFGTYITSTFTERQLDERLNQGLVIVSSPGKGDIIRVNTRSLKNSVSTEPQSQSNPDSGTGILSWFTPKWSSPASRILALKVIPRSSTIELEEAKSRQDNETPYAIAKRISEEVQRAVIGPENVQNQAGFIEEGDIISAVEAKKRTGYLEQLGHSLKKLVWA